MTVDMEEQGIFIKQETVINHFITNPAWKRIFNKHYPDFVFTNGADYIEKAWDIFQTNGYRYELEPMSKNTKSAFSKVVVIDLFKGDKFIIGQRNNISNCLQQLIIMVLCDYEVDFDEFN